MRPQQLQAYRSGVASRLDDVELVAALLERAAGGTRAFCAERGAPMAPVPGERLRWRVRVREASVRGFGEALKFVRSTARSAFHPRIIRAISAALHFVIDLARVLLVVASGLLVVAIAVMLAAPPV
jgi:hypothetical protein